MSHVVYRLLHGGYVSGYLEQSSESLYRLKNVLAFRREEDDEGDTTIISVVIKSEAVINKSKVLRKVDSDTAHSILFGWICEPPFLYENEENLVTAQTEPGIWINGIISGKTMIDDDDITLEGVIQFSKDSNKIRINFIKELTLPLKALKKKSTWPVLKAAVNTHINQLQL